MAERNKNNFYQHTKCRDNHSECSPKKCIDALIAERDKIEALFIAKVTADVQLNCLREKCCLEKQLIDCQCYISILQSKISACQGQDPSTRKYGGPDLSEVHASADCQTDTYDPRR